MIIITDTYSQPDAPDPVLADDRVLELVRRHAGSARKVTFIDESGGEARAYMCDDDLVLKTQRPQQLRPRTSLEKEAFILRPAGSPGRCPEGPARTRLRSRRRRRVPPDDLHPRRAWSPRR
jgi:hypothetical protein